MSNINVGTIFALETDLPKYVDLVKISSLNLREKRYALKTWKLFSDLKDNDEINTYLELKEKKILKSIRDLVEEDLFFNTLLWLDTNMVVLRKIFREAFIEKDKQGRVNSIKKKLQEIVFPDREARKSINKIVEELEKDASIFDIEQKLDDYVFRILQRGAKGNSIKSAYLENKRNYYKVSSRSRKEYLKGIEEVDTKVIDEIEKDLAENEIKFSNDSVINVDPDLVLIGYLVKIKYLMYDLRIIFNNVGKDAEALMINYDFK